MTMSSQNHAEHQGSLEHTLEQIHTESGANLLGLTKSSSVLLIFLRHFGCAFCRQAISDIADLRAALEERKVRPVFVHLGTPERAKAYFDYYHLEDVERVSDPDATIYRNPPFALARQHPAWQFFDPRVWFQWFRGALFKHGIGKIQEDGHQMPGIFFLKDGKIVRTFRYKAISDQPKYLKISA